MRSPGSNGYGRSIVGGGRPGRARPIPSSATSRAIPNTATSGRRAGDAVPPPVLQQQRQFLRLPRPPTSTEDFFRRVVRWEHDGTMTVIADSYQGKPLNSPNDLVPHLDAASGPPTRLTAIDPRGPSRRAGGSTNRRHPESAHRRRKCRGDRRSQAGIADRRLSLGPERQARRGDHQEQLPDPNGICFSPTTRRFT